jgi:hypothetical protein
VADIEAGDAYASVVENGFEGLGPEFERVANLYQQAGRQIQATQAVYSQAGVALTENRLEDALRLTHSGLARGVDLSDVFLQAWGLEYAATIALKSGDVELAGLLVGAAQAQRERAGGGSGPATIESLDATTLLVERFGEGGAEKLIAPGRLVDLAEGVELATAQDEE